MKKSNILFFMAFALLAAAFASIAIYNYSLRVNRDCSLYFLNSSGTSLVLENRRVSCRYEYDIPEAVLKQLIKGPENAQNSRVVSRKTKLNSITDDGQGNYSVDFSEQFLSDDNAKQLFSVYAVVKTFCSLYGVQSVKLTVGGNELTLSDGTVIGTLTAEDINLSIDTYSGETHYVTLYFTDTATKKLANEVRSVRITDQQPVEQYVINELIKGPQYGNRSRVLDSATTLISVTVSDNIAFVNFAKNFLDKNDDSPERGELAVFAIVNSLTELESINRVQFLIEGKKVEKFGELSIEHPIGRNEDIIEK